MSAFVVTHLTNLVERSEAHRINAFFTTHINFQKYLVKQYIKSLSEMHLNEGDSIKTFQSYFPPDLLRPDPKTLNVGQANQTSAEQQTVHSLVPNQKYHKIFN